MTTENQVESAQPAPSVPAHKFIFVAVYPRENQLPAYLDDIEKNGWTLLHPAYNWEAPEGQRVRALINLHKKIDLPTVGDAWSRAASRDYFAVRASDIMVYDTDNEPGHHFLAAAQIFQIPVVAVSPRLLSVPAYFSGVVKAVVKPQNLLQSLT